MPLQLQKLLTLPVLHLRGTGCQLRLPGADICAVTG